MLASRTLWIGCALHIVALVAALPFALQNAPAWFDVTLIFIVPGSLLLLYFVTFVTATPISAREREWTGRKHDWVNGKVCLAWFFVQLCLLVANVALHFKIKMF